MSPEELEQLRKELTAQNNSQLKTIYDAYRKDIIRFMLDRNYCSLEKAQDYFSDAILIFRKNIITRKIEVLTNVKSYLISICVNLSRNETYKEIRRKEKVRLLYSNEPNDILEIHNIKDERIVIVKKALLKLTDRCQKILIAFYVHKLRMKEIAEDLGLSSSDVAKTLKMRCYKSWIKEAKNLL